jgi:PleD family two-component response regulator
MGKVLIIDDTPQNIDILIDILDSHDISVALDGESGIAMCSDEDFELFLIDIVMPDMDGFEVCKTLKQNPKTAPVPVIFITAHTDYESIDKCFEVGGADYVSKPFHKATLKARVDTQLKLHKRG